MYNFDQTINRLQTNSMKWDGMRHRLTPDQQAANPLPMWVADMDFRVAQPIRDAIHREAEFGVFGYGQISESYVEAAIEWQRRRFNWVVRPEWLVPSSGVVNALNMAIQTFSHPGDYILVQPPVYIHFHQDIVINGRRLLEAPLARTTHGYRFDPEAFEAAIRPGTKLFILCNPHNPTGNVWSREDLMTMGAICQRHGIIVVSDEIHADLIFDRSLQHIPFASLDPGLAENCIVCTSPGKTFNTAGLQCANIFIPNPRLRAAFRAQCERSGLNLVNTIGAIACEAAYRFGESWVDAMVDYVGENQRHFAATVRDHALPVNVVPTGALYLAWLDCRSLGLPPNELHDHMLRNVGLWLDPGSKFGATAEGFMRINLACPRSTVNEALRRLTTYL
ncbi:MalY/PatB family protein [Cupriavidus sp. 2SB]|uniref:MalY/PatB family protein n=1 Tax=Cupriavidus sp. 2SB TaxID=2502199 RepID=UPI0010F65E95|nr:MalY/PatB family protein [Cupriavidus sp. 2SB]